MFVDRRTQELYKNPEQKRKEEKMVDVAEVNPDLVRYICPNPNCESNQGAVQRFFVNLGTCPFCGASLKKVDSMIPY